MIWKNNKRWKKDFLTQVFSDKYWTKFYFYILKKKLEMVWFCFWNEKNFFWRKRKFFFWKILNIVLEIFFKKKYCLEKSDFFQKKQLEKSQFLKKLNCFEGMKKLKIKTSIFVTKKWSFLSWFKTLKKVGQCIFWDGFFLQKKWNKSYFNFFEKKNNKLI